MNEAGLAQAEKTARRIEDWPVDAVYTSPLTRARQTADVIAARHNTDPIVVEDLTEINFGSWEGAYFRKLLEKKDGSLLKWIADPFFSSPLGGEEWDSIKPRSERAANLVMDSGFKHSVIVSHGGIIRALIVAFLGFDPHTVWKIKASNCSLTGIEIREHERSLAFANDDLHLREAQKGGLPSLW
jgi:alpha-ribazole phosphatase/probable phosphoglycerate mutase